MFEANRGVNEAVLMSSCESLVEMLAEAALRLNRHLDLEQLLHDVVDLCLDAVHADACFVYLYEQDELVLRASSNAHPEEVGQLRMRIGEGITGWVAQQRRPVALSSQAMQDARFKFYSVLPEDSFEAFLSVPILFRNQVLGVVNLQHRDIHEHGGAEVKAVSAIGLMLGEALDRAGKIAEIQQRERHRAALQELVDLCRGNLFELLPRACEVIAEATRARTAALVLSSTNSKEIRRAFWAAAGEAAPAVTAEQMENLLAISSLPASGPIDAGNGTILCPIHFREGLAGCLVLQIGPERIITAEDLQQAGLLTRMLATGLEADEWRDRCRAQEEALAARKLIERAKGVLQKEQQISEDEAYRLLQQESRRNRRPMAAVAQALLTSRQLLGPAASQAPSQG